MAGVSTVPSVLDKLVELTRAALPDVQVWDGESGRDLAHDFVCIGHTGEPGEEAVTDTRTREQLTSDPDTESYEVACLASAWRGRENDAKAVRDGVYALVDAVNGALMADHTLDGLAMTSRLTTVGLTQTQSDDGATATVRFSITVMADTTG